jgi:hypothetical protein
MRLIAVLLSSMIVLSSSTGYTGTCDTRLDLCIEVVKDSKTVIDAQDTEINSYKEKSALDEQIKADQAKVIESPLHDPVKVGLAATILVIVLELATGHLK